MKNLALLLLVSVFAFTNIAAAQAMGPSISGEWDATMSTPGGARQFKIVFKQEGEKLSGTIKREAGDTPLIGTIKGSAVQFSYTVDYNGNALTLTMTTKLDGNSMKGTVSFGGQAEDEFSATRAPAKPADTPHSSPSYASDFA